MFQVSLLAVARRPLDSEIRVPEDNE